MKGVLVARAGISPVIATLATWQAILGLNLLWTDGQPVTTFAEDYRWMGSAKIGVITAALAVALVYVVVARTLLYNTAFGRYVYAVGGNAEAARLAGVKIARTRLLSYMVCAVFTAGGALVLSSQVGSGFADLGQGLEIQVIAAVFIGGAAWEGGAGRVGAVMMGVALLVLLRNGLDLIGTSTNLQTVITGGLIAAAVGLNNLRDRGRARG